MYANAPFPDRLLLDTMNNVDGKQTHKEKYNSGHSRDQSSINWMIRQTSINIAVIMMVCGVVWRFTNCRRCR